MGNISYLVGEAETHDCVQLQGRSMAGGPVPSRKFYARGESRPLMTMSSSVTLNPGIIVRNRPSG